MNKVTISKLDNDEDYYGYGIYLLEFKNKFYIGKASKQTFEDRRKQHEQKAYTETCDKAMQLREEGGCNMSILYKFKNSRISNKKRECIITLIENYLIYRGCCFAFEELYEIPSDDLHVDFHKFKNELKILMLNTQY